MPVGVRWRAGGASAQKFAREGFFTVVTTRTESNAAALAAAIREQGNDSMIVELDLSKEESISRRFRQIRAEAGEPEVVVYNAGYLEGRDLPAEKELLEYVPVSDLRHRDRMSPAAARSSCAGSAAGDAQERRGVVLLLEHPELLRGRRRFTGQSPYYPRAMMRTLSQVLTEEYSEFGVHVANVVIDGTIDSPGTRMLPRNANRTDQIINPTKIAEAFWYLHTQDKTCWSHEIQLTPHPVKPSY